MHIYYKRNINILGYKDTYYISLSTIVLNSRDRQGMYGMQHFRMPRNAPYNRL